MAQFFARPQDIDEAQGTALLRGEEAHHLARVMRLGPGDAVRLFDGAGRRFAGKLALASGGEARVEGLAALDPGEPPGPVHLIQGLLKGDRWEWLLEKATELGATRITPILAQRSVARDGGQRSDSKRDRWEKILLAAAKQCERGVVPALDAPQSLEALLEALGPRLAGEERWACQERREGLAIGPPAAGCAALLAVGPEGGWTPQEAELLAGAGFAAASLGPRILRGETAALAALALAAARPG